MSEPSQKNGPNRAESLRRRAEEELKKTNGGPQAPKVQARQLLHELSVHQVELEMQNEELVRARHELEEARDQYIRLYDFAPVGYLRLDADGLILAANLTFSTLAKVERTALLGRPFGSLVHQEDWREFYRILGRGEALVRGEVRLVRSDQTLIWVLLQADRTVDDEGRLEEVLLAVTDITDARRDRETLKKLNTGLEERVAERTALAEFRSQQLRKLASELTRSEQRERERLARVLHDNIQQLLVAAKLQLEMAKTKGVPARKSKGIQQAMLLLDQSLDASRALTVELSPSILYEAGLGAALEWLARQMERRYCLQVHLELHGEVPVDEEGVVLLLYASVSELLMNVVKHAAVKKARVLMDQLEDHVVQVIVSDEGKGFDMAVLDHPDRSGTGLGLFALRERIQHVGGCCDIFSIPDRGTRVTLAAVAMPPDKEAAKAAPIAGQRHLPFKIPRGEKIRLLLVDDHTMMRQGLAGLLGQEPDMEVVGEAGTGADAIKLASRLRPDVVLMDVNMPGMSGIEAARRIADTVGAKVIGLSMFEGTDLAKAMLDAGAFSYLQKTGPGEQLLSAVRSAAAQP